MSDMEEFKFKFKISKDDDGYIDKECPADNCKYQFKVFEEDWVNLFNDEKVYCPLCGVVGKSNTFWTTEQIENAQKQALEQVKNSFFNMLHDVANDFNSKQNNNGMIKISMKVSGHKQPLLLLPLSAMKEFQSKIQCEKCNSRYAVLGSAFFCPCCGNNSVERTFDDAIKKVAIKIDKIDEIRNSLIKSNPDEAEVFTRSVIEGCLSDLVVAFQRFCEASYKHFLNEEKLPNNIFQNLEEGSKLWKKKFNEGYEDWIDEKDLNDLNVFFQQRHLLLHKEGIVDSRYLEKSKDNTYREGQRIVISKDIIKKTMQMINIIIAKIKGKIKVPNNPT